MVLKYFDSTVNLTKIYRQHNPEMPADFVVSEECKLAEFMEETTSSTSGYYDYSMGSSDPKDMEILLAKLGYFSNQDASTISWDFLANQIDNCRPVLLSIFGSDQFSRHQVVVKGYYKKGYQRFLVVYDPWGNCFGQVYSLNYEVLSDPESHIRSQEYIANIDNKLNLSCKSCGVVQTISSGSLPTPRESYFVTAGRIDIDSLTNIISSGGSLASHTVDVSTVDSQKMKLATGFDGDVFLNYTIKDVVLDENTVFRYQRFSNEKWKLIKIMENFYYTNGFTQNMPDQLVIVPSLNTSFFKYRLNGMVKFKPQYSVNESLKIGTELVPDALWRSMLDVNSQQIRKFQTVKWNEDFYKLETTIKKLELTNDLPQSKRIKPLSNNLRKLNFDIKNKINVK